MFETLYHVETPTGVPTVNQFQSVPQLNFISPLFLKMTKPYLNIF